MFTLYAFDRKPIEKTTLSVPGTKLNVGALIYHGVPFYHVVDIISAIVVKGRTKAPITANAYAPLHRVINESNHGIGTVIITHRGVYADTDALRCLISTFFWDVKHSTEFQLIQTMMRGCHTVGGGFPAIRTIGDKALYESIIGLGRAEAVFENAKKQVRDSDLTEIVGYKSTGVGKLQFEYKTDAAAVEEPTVSDDDREACADAYQEAVENSLNTHEQSKQLSNLTVADFIQLAKQLLTTREVTITVSVK